MQTRKRLSPDLKIYSTRQRSRSRSRASPCQIAALRMRDLNMLFRVRYGMVMPDDDAGRDDIEVAVNHLASLAHPHGRITAWLEIWAPWITLAERDKLISTAVLRQQHWTADQLAWRVRLTWDERQSLGITTIGAIDCSKAQRTKRRRLKAAERERARRTRLKAACAP